MATLTRVDVKPVPVYTLPADGARDLHDEKWMRMTKGARLVVARHAKELLAHGTQHRKGTSLL